MLVSSGSDLDSAYVITTKPIGALDREGTRLVATTPATMSPGMISTKVALNQAKLDYVCLGNHEFDFGMEVPAYAHQVEVRRAPPTRTCPSGGGIGRSA